jgi:hypothetical protein
VGTTADNLNAHRSGASTHRDGLTLSISGDGRGHDRPEDVNRELAR